MTTTDEIASSWNTAASVKHLASPAALAEHLPEGHQTGSYIRRPHLDLINALTVDAFFNRLPEGCGNRLIINIAPQTGKSTLNCLWTPVWVNELIARGVLPPGMFGFATYEGSLAKSWGRACREAINDNASRLVCRVSSITASMDEWETTTTPTGGRGGMIARGIGGAFTGRPARYLVIDDPNKSETIHSKEERDDAWRWWLGTGTQRIHPEAPVIVIQARLHQDDFTGRLLSKDHEGDPRDWMVVRIPSIAEEETQPDPLGREIGDPLYRPDVKHTKEEARNFWIKKEREVGSYRAVGTYRQRPTAAGGSLFKKSKMRSWLSENGDPLSGRGHYLLPREDNPEADRRVLVRSCMRFAIADVATSIKQEADFTVATLFDLTPYWDILVVDVYREKLEANDRLEMLKEINRKWRPIFIGIESVGFQLSDVQHARKVGLNIQEVKAKGDKWARALTASARMEAGQVYFHPNAPWLASFVNELLEFPGGVYDDQVDTLSYAAIAADDLATKSGWSVD